ncbi:hypothetical protein [Aequorivita lipolytica]|uniref:Tetratricopeptide repeat protein n=1 Tax=Aequorivita lipolytica TaxID=153267 RepID=A0A5C6YNW3_9FLAO|nr:hypothetical protein [Aequorivita lipolytica]TXD69310.1 hypothetical protein ESV24_08090 [Aequorivita lipolytica]SRX50068.1 hypothetical protein AEQU2_00534 [Aequorivita lipolytica]
MITKRKLLFCFLFTGISAISFSQSKLHKTDVNKDIDVARVYEQVVEEGYGTPLIYKKLATTYYFKSEYGKAVAWFQKLFSEEKNTDPEIENQYNQALKAVAVTNSRSLQSISFLK